MNHATAVALAFVVTTATLSVAVVGAGATALSQQTLDAQSDSDAYAGTHVAFETGDESLQDYLIDGEPILENVRVESQSEAGGGADADLSAVADLTGVGLELGVQTDTRAEVATEGFATITAYDTERGILTVDAGDDAQYVELELAAESNAEAHAEHDDRVVVETDERSGSLIVVGDGNVTVNEYGNVAAELENESTLVFRSYADGEREEGAERQAELIAEGTATAEVYADERDGERVADVATYGQNVTVEVHEQTEDRLEMTATRTQSEGTVVIASVSEAAMGTTEHVDDLEVTVDGEAAVEASSYDELEGGIAEEPRYLVSHSGEASAAADVLVAVDHFSEREIAIQDGEADESADDDAADDDAAESVPGFGAVTALTAALVAVVTRLR